MREAAGRLARRSLFTAAGFAVLAAVFLLSYRYLAPEAPVLYDNPGFRADVGKMTNPEALRKLVLDIVSSTDQALVTTRQALDAAIYVAFAVLISAAAAFASLYLALKRLAEKAG
jgi:hypothetical protein